MVIGPFVGGLITKNYGEQSAAFFAAFFSFLSIVIALIFIPGNTKSVLKDEKSVDDSVNTGELFFTSWLNLPSIFINLDMTVS